MRTITAAVLLLAASSASGQVNRCEIDGHLTWQSDPCPPGTTVTPEQAPGPEPTQPQGGRYSQCQAYSELATSVITARMEGVPMPNLMGRAERNPLVEELVIEAFEIPRFSSGDTRDRIVQDFADDHYLECVKIYRATESAD